MLGITAPWIKLLLLLASLFLAKQPAKNKQAVLLKMKGWRIQPYGF